MKHYKLAFYTLLFSFIWISCEDDEIAPEIQINTPVENTEFCKSQVLTVDATFTDNKELDFVAILLTGPDDESVLRKIELSGETQAIQEEFELLFEGDGMITLNINVVDREGNSTSYNQSYEYKSIESGILDLNIKLEYNGEPLVLFEDYNYPDDKKIDFTRFSMYTSEMKLDETLVNEVEFHNLTNSHSSTDLAANGYTWQQKFVPPGTYSTFSFNIGVPEELNGKDPGEFPSGHPLAKPAENWFSWMSYIFMKVEGNVDLDGDGDAETGVALHTGSDAALRNIQLDYPIEIKVDEVSTINLVLDLYDLFNGQTRIFPIEENPQIHSLSQMEAVTEISDNLLNSIHKQ